VLGLVQVLECDRCKQAFETAWYVPCACEALASLRFRHLGCHFMKPSDFEDISFSKVLHFIQGAGLLNESAKVLHKTSITVKVHGSLCSRPFVFFSFLLGHIPPSQNTTQRLVLTLTKEKERVTVCTWTDGFPVQRFLTICGLVRQRLWAGRCWTEKKCLNKHFLEN
jgi:hypothetical protein